MVKDPPPALTPRSRVAPYAFHLIAALGLALALYLTLLKFTALPCHAPGDCQKIIHSTYGSIFRLPVGLYAAVIWIAALLQRDATLRAVWLAFLALSTVGFMVIQFAVLRGFCLYCTLHALCTWAAFALRRASPRPRFTILAALLLAAVGFAFTYHRAHTLPAVAPTSSLAPQALRLSSAAGLPWLAPVGEKSSTLILSLDCPACLELLESLTRHDFTRVKTGPALFFKTTDANRALTREFVAATLAQKSLSIRDALLATTTLLLSQKDLVLTQPEAAAQALAALIPAAASEYPLADRILETHTRAFLSASLPATTPLLHASDGTATLPTHAAALFAP